MRLEQGHDGISDARRERRAQPRVEELLDRRQPRHPREQPVCPRGRRHGARDADRGGGGRVEGAGRRVQGRQQHRHAQLGQEVDLRHASPRRRAQLEPPKEVKLKEPKDWKIAGKPLKRLDTLDKVTGKQIYGIDYACPACWSRPCTPARCIGGKLKSFDAAKVEKMPGVKKVVSVDGNAVVVVADTYWNARTALAALPGGVGRRQAGRGPAETITAMLKEGLDASEAFVGNKAGDAKAAIDGAAKKVEATYSLPLAAPRHHGADERHRALSPPTSARCGAARRTARRRSLPRRRRPSCRSPSAMSTSSCWAAASAGAAAPTMCARPCWWPSRCPARRSS